MAIRLMKHFHRDFSLCISTWWPQVFREQFQKAVGASYSDYIAVNDGVSSVYFAPEEDERKLKEATLRYLKETPQAYFDLCAEFRKNAKTSRKIVKEIREKSGLGPEAYRTLKARFFLLFPCLRLSIRIPSWWAEDLRKVVGGETAEKVISLSYENRLLSDGIFEEIDAAVRLLSELEIKKQGRLPLLAKFLMANEVEALASEEEIGWAFVEERLNGYVYCKGRLYATRDYQNVLAENGYEYFEEQITASAPLKGTVAFKGGVVKGSVRKLMALEQLPQFKEGEVLVSPMTVPQYLPAMKKAIAIVTDEGGITCHAAIVARELGKPCVIGTKHATKVLQDGNLVEVDSEKGIVRKV